MAHEQLELEFTVTSVKLIVHEVKMFYMQVFIFFKIAELLTFKLVNLQDLS